MGCLNSDQGFAHWFGNVHLTAPYCNRSCGFCIGQHMLSLEAHARLEAWPLPGYEEFVATCKERGVSEVNVTGTNTEPLLYEGLEELTSRLRADLGGRLGLRTNGVLAVRRRGLVELFDKLSVTICSFDPVVYRATMGNGLPPDLGSVLEVSGERPLKVNCVLGPENTAGRTFSPDADVYRTLERCSELGVAKVNLREPYGQPHVGDPMSALGLEPVKLVHGNPCYLWQGVEVTWWDVHYTEVESVNVYASGRVSVTYPITRGHAPEGEVLAQENFTDGRTYPQWLGSPRRREPVPS